MFSLNYCSHRTYLIIIVLFSFFIYYNSLNQPKDFSMITQSSNSIRIMYVIRTSSHFYHKRLIYLLQTWISLVHNDVFFVTDIFLPNISHDHMILTKKTCGSDAHSMGILCCKTAHDFILFHRYKSKYNWFCHFDDDQYVNVNNLKEYLSTFDSNRPYYIGRTSWPDTLKRSKEPFPQPFWFATLGAGVCLSKRTINLLKPYTQSASEFADGCIRENYHDDIYLGFVLNGYLNISLTKTNRFHSHLEKTFYNDKQTFLSSYTNQITFGFRSPDRYPHYLPPLYTSHTDPYHIRTLHCYLYTQFNECQRKIRQQLFNSTK
jgi:fringe protein